MLLLQRFKYSLKYKLNWLVFILFLVYLWSMVISPLAADKCDWECVKNVWRTWQGLNVGVFAFISSVIAFNISIFNSNKQRKRNFVASRAFLPEALSDLTTYLKDCSDLLKASWEKVMNDDDESVPESLVPALPSGYRETFASCITYSESDVGEYLANILTLLQVNHSRLKSLPKECNGKSKLKARPHNIVSYLHMIGELQALINNLFEFARAEVEFNENSLTLEDYHTAYSNLDINSENYKVDLKGNKYYCLADHTKSIVDSKYSKIQSEEAE